jgi:hypothetical protein
MSSPVPARQPARRQKVVPVGVDLERPPVLKLHRERVPREAQLAGKLFLQPRQGSSARAVCVQKLRARVHSRILLLLALFNRRYTAMCKLGVALRHGLRVGTRRFAGEPLDLRRGEVKLGLAMVREEVREVELR